MKYGFHTSAVNLGKLRNTIGSSTRIFKYCNRNSPNLNVTFNCVFNKGVKQNLDNFYFESYHILNNEVLPDDNIISYATKNTISRGPFTPNQIKNVYSINNILPVNGIRKSIITIIGAYNNPRLSSDVTKFGNLYGLPPCDMTVYNFTNKFSSSWAIECTLDVQWAYAINPYAKIRVICAASNSWNDIFNAVQFANNKNNFSPKIDTDIISMSLGTKDNGGLSRYNSFFSNTNTIYVAASGDSSTVSFPSSATNVISIGGTSLNLNSNNSRNSETVWSSSGCGYSLSFLRPSYQPVISNNGRRVTPDMSCVADPKTPAYVIVNGKTYSIGGTSLSAPIYAGMLSIITQNILNNNKSTFTSVQGNSNTIQPLLYANKNNFYDIISGSSLGNRARLGFDSASGLGAINLNNIIV